MRIKRWLFSCGFENLITSRAHAICREYEDDLLGFYACSDWVKSDSCFILAVKLIYGTDLRLNTNCYAEKLAYFSLLIFKTCSFKFKHRYLRLQ